MFRFGTRPRARSQHRKNLATVGARPRPSSVPRQLSPSPMMIFPIRIEMANVTAVQRPHDADARKHRRAVTAIPKTDCVSGDAGDAQSRSESARFKFRKVSNIDQRLRNRRRMLARSPPRHRQSSVTESVVLPPDPRGQSCLHFSLKWYRTIPATASRKSFNCGARCSGSPAPYRAGHLTGMNVGRSPLHCVASLETSGG
jgi:hypothetical protein